MRAATIGANPTWDISRRTGTATFFRCIPISVLPISSPASARISSSATGSLSFAYAAVANAPPALGTGMTFTIVCPTAALRSVIIARLRCSQHWAARKIPCREKTEKRASKTILPISGPESVPIFLPDISLVEQPTITICPALSPALSHNSIAAR